MDLLKVKKKARENNFKFLTSFICSIIIHMFIFLFFYENNIKKISLHSMPHTNIVRLELVKKATEVPTPPDFSARIPHKQKSQKNKKNSSESKMSSLLEPKTDPEFNEKQNEFEHKQVVDTPSTQQIQQANPIESLKLPKSLLGQNIFPKQYKVHFQFQRKNNEIVGIEVSKFQPLAGNYLYADKLIEKAFLKELNDLSISEITNWLQLYQKHQYAPENIKILPKDNFYIVLEFQEPN